MLLKVINKSSYQVWLLYIHIPNNAKPCVTSHCVCPLTYEYSTYTTHECDMSQWYEHHWSYSMQLDAKNAMGCLYKHSFVNSTVILFSSSSLIISVLITESYNVLVTLLMLRKY